MAIDDIYQDDNLDLVTIRYAPDVKNPKQIGVTVLLGDGKAGLGLHTRLPCPLRVAEGSTGCRQVT